MSLDFNNNYFLNDKCVASSLTATHEIYNDILVPSLKLVHDTTSAITSDIDTISSDIYKNATSEYLLERGLSGKVDFLLSADRQNVWYGGTLKSIYRDPSLREPYFLSNFLIDNGISSFIKSGFMFRLSAEQAFYTLDIREPSCFIFSANDYFIVNKNVFASSITSADIDVIYDAKSEVSTAIKNLCVEIQEDLSGYARLSARNTFVEENTFTKQTYMNGVFIDHLSAKQISVGFDYVFDDDPIFLSDMYAPLTEDSYCIAVATLINDIIRDANLEDIEDIDVSKDFVDDLADRTVKICEKAHVTAATNDLWAICESLNKCLGAFKLKGTSLEYRLSRLQQNIDEVEKYIDRTVISLEGLSGEVAKVSADLQRQIRSNDQDIARLEDEIAGGAGGIKKLSSHYFNTFVTKEIPKTGTTISVDNLILNDERLDNFDKYRMTFKYGTITLVKE